MVRRAREGARTTAYPIHVNAPWVMAPRVGSWVEVAVAGC